MSGVIEGGWGYVAAAWGLSLGVLLAYSLIVSFRVRAAEARLTTADKES